MSATKYETKKLDLEKATTEQKAYRARVEALLISCRWNVSEASKKAKLSRTAMYRRIYALGLKAPAGMNRGSSIFDHKIAGVR